MNKYIHSICFLLPLFMACSSENQYEEHDKKEIQISASINNPVTKVNNKGDAFIKDDVFNLYNTGYEPSKTLANRYAQYKYTENKQPETNGNKCSAINKGLTWENILRDGNRYFFTATSEPEISAVYTDQSRLEDINKCDFLVARKVHKVATERWKPVHLKFHHVLCKVNISVEVPIGNLDFAQNALTKAVLINRQTTFKVDYSPTYTDEDKAITTSGTGSADQEITLYKVSANVANNKQTYVYQAIIPSQSTLEGTGFAQFTIGGKTYTYKSTSSNNQMLALKQGWITQIKLRIEPSSNIPIELGTIKLLPWNEASADLGELEPEQQP